MKKLVLGALALAAVTVSAGSASAAPKLTNITLQLKWVPQALFAGYYAALDLGYYKAAGLNVKAIDWKKHMHITVAGGQRGGDADRDAVTRVVQNDQRLIHY